MTPEQQEFLQLLTGVALIVLGWVYLSRDTGEWF